MDSPINPHIAVATSVDCWLGQLRAEERFDGTTIDEYERVLRDLIIPGLGAVDVSEITTSRIDEVLIELGTQSRETPDFSNGRGPSRLRWYSASRPTPLNLQPCNGSEIF